MNTGRTPLHLFLEETYVLNFSFNPFSCCHVHRIGNAVALLEARLVPPNGVENLFLNSFPEGILIFAELDVLSIYMVVLQLKRMRTVCLRLFN